jgi:hypothetical protein
MKHRKSRSPELAAEVRKLAATGAAESDIAAILELPEPKLCKLYQKDLERGAAEGKQTALNKIYEVAMSGEHLNALTFWIKSRCGWRDTGEAKPEGTVFLQPVINITSTNRAKRQSDNGNPPLQS